MRFAWIGAVHLHIYANSLHNQRKLQEKWLVSTYTPDQSLVHKAEAFNSHWQPQLEFLLARGRTAGADLVEVYLEQIDHLSVLAEQDTITSVNPSFGRGAGIRVFLGKQDGFVSTNDLSDAGLKHALDQALSMLGIEVNEAVRSSFEGLPNLRDFAIDKAHWLNQCPELSEASDRLLNGTQLLDQNGTHLQVRRGSYARDWQEVLVAASDGTLDGTSACISPLGLMSLLQMANTAQALVAVMELRDDQTTFASGMPKRVPRKFAKAQAQCFMPITWTPDKCQQYWPTALVV